MSFLYHGLGSCHSALFFSRKSARHACDSLLARAHRYDGCANQAAISIIPRCMHRPGILGNGLKRLASAPRSRRSFATATDADVESARRYCLKQLQYGVNPFPSPFFFDMTRQLYRLVAFCYSF